MPKAPVNQNLVFVLHALGGVLFFAHLLRFLFGPIDLFIHQRYLQSNVVQCGLSGALFYAFSLSLLWKQPLPAGWGVAYASLSLLFLTVIFTPTLGDMPGMMRRVAVSEDYETYHRTAQKFRAAFQLILSFLFLLMQTVFLRTFLRKAPPNSLLG